jgi:branched-chain amino acid transport system ATP-binding protein
MLRLENVSSQYDAQVIVLRDITLTVVQGAITCLLGSNGAGKTTLMKTVVNLLRPTQGRIYFGDKRIDGLKTHQIIELGISVVPEGRRIFPQFTVFDNLRVGAFLSPDLPWVRKKMEEVVQIFPILKERISQFGETLSGGEQGMLAIARALMSEPKLLLLDEPSLGLAPLLVRELFKVIKRINERGVTVLLIEQNARKALSIASKGYVLQKGEVVAEGSREELRNSEILRLAYLRG